MALDWLKVALGLRSESSTPHSKALEVERDVKAGASALKAKVSELDKYKKACNEAGLSEDFKNAVASAHDFAAKSLAYVKRHKGSDDAGGQLLCEYDDVISNLTTLAVAANSAGIDLQAEARAIFEASHDLVARTGLSGD